MDIKNVLGKRIKELRKAKGLTQEQAAELINIETKSFSNIETGKVFPTAANLNKIMQILGITPFDLFNYEHLKPCNELIDEMVTGMRNNEKLTRLMYKIFKTVK